MSDAALTSAAIAHSFDWVAVGHALGLPADSCRTRFAALQASALSSDDGDIDLDDLLGNESSPVAAPEAAPPTPLPRARAPPPTTIPTSVNPPSSAFPSVADADVFDFDAESALRVADAELSARLDAALSGTAPMSTVGGSGGGGGGSERGGDVWDRVLSALGGPLDAAAAARISIPAAMPRSVPFSSAPREPRERPIPREINESEVVGGSTAGCNDGELDADAEREIARVTSYFYDSTRGGGGARAVGVGSFDGTRDGGGGGGGASNAELVDLQRFFPQPSTGGPSFAGFDFSREKRDDVKNGSAWDALLADVQLPERGGGDVRSYSELSRVLLELGAASAAAMTDVHAKTGALWETATAAGGNDRSAGGVASPGIASHYDDDNDALASAATPSVARGTTRTALHATEDEGGRCDGVAEVTDSAPRGRGRAAAGRFLVDDDDADDALDAASLRAALKARAAHAVATAPPAALAAAHQSAASASGVPSMGANEASLLMRLWREQRTAAGTRAIPLQNDDADGDSEDNVSENENAGESVAGESESEGDEAATAKFAGEESCDAEGEGGGESAGGAVGFTQGDVGDVLDYTDTPAVGLVPLLGGGGSDEGTARSSPDGQGGGVGGGSSKPRLSVAERYGLDEDEGFSTRILKSQQRVPPRPTAAAALEGTAAALREAVTEARRGAWLSRPEALVQPY